MSTILCYGDSNTYGYDPRDRFGRPYSQVWPTLTAEKTGYTMINYGQPGRQLPKYEPEWDALRYQMERYYPDKVMIMLGTNDILNSRTSDLTEIGERMRRLIDFIQKDCNLSQIDLIVPPEIRTDALFSPEYLLQYRQAAVSEANPMELIDRFRILSAELAVLYKEIADEKGCGYIDTSDWKLEMAYDGVHLSQTGHIQFAEQILPLL